MIQDAVLAHLLPKQPLETRLAAAIETATSAYLSALDDEDRATGKVVCSEGGSDTGRCVAANNWMAAGAQDLEHPSSSISG